MGVAGAGGAQLKAVDAQQIPQIEMMLEIYPAAQLVDLDHVQVPPWLAEELGSRWLAPGVLVRPWIWVAITGAEGVVEHHQPS